MRNLVSVKQISEIKSIPNADLICAYKIDGWYVVDKVGAYEVGQHVIFCEVDSFIPTEIAPFLSKGKEPKVYNGVRGERLRTIRLKGQISQGLILPLHTVTFPTSKHTIQEELGIQKWEPPPEFSHADAKGLFPAFIPKTDQTRIQSCFDLVTEKSLTGVNYEVTEKLEGSSITMYCLNSEFSVCSRNLELKESETNTYWKTAKEYSFDTILKSLNRNLAFQGEIVGPGLNGNIYKLDKFMIFIYDIFDIDNGTYLDPKSRSELCVKLGVTQVPILHKDFDGLGVGLEAFLSSANGKSVIGHTDTLREGLVYKANSKDRFTFKTISNEYLLKQK